MYYVEVTNEWFRTKTRFDTEAKGNLKMAYPYDKFRLNRENWQIGHISGISYADCLQHT